MSFQEHAVSYENGEKSIAYISAGPEKGPLLIFVHGWPDTSLEWTSQLEHFASSGYRVIAPDLPGVGRSTANRVLSDYSLEKIANGLRALLAHLGLGKAIWIGHDWGSAVISTICATSPELVIGAVLIAVPYRTLELGLDELMTFVNRDIYPIDKYPWAQWSYQVHYLQASDDVTAFYDCEPEGWLKLCHRPEHSENLWKPAPTATVAEDGGPGGGPSKMPKPPAADMVPYNLLGNDRLAAYTAAYKKTGFYGVNALYMNHKENREYNLDHAINDGKLDFPVLFIEAKYDIVCAVATTRVADPQRRLCSKLTEVTIESGHWVPLEKPDEVNDAIGAWLRKSFESGLLA